MKNYICYLHTDMEHGHTEERLRLAAARVLQLQETDSRLAAARTKEGALWFPLAPSLHCSVSHSGGVWLCAFSDQPVGVDLQRHETRPTEKIAARFFHQAEQDFLKKQEAVRFFDVWCAKESYLKYTGAGLTAGLNSFSVVNSAGLVPAVCGVPLRLVPFLPDFSLCLCGGNAEEILLQPL